MKNRPHLRTKLPVAALFVGIVLSAVACSSSTVPDDSSELEAVVGTYTVTTLRFNPQGSLPDQDILEALEVETVQLILTLNRAAQIAFLDPVTQLFVTVQGSFQMIGEGLRVQWDANGPFGELLFSRTMDFSFDSDAGTLSFDADAPDGVSRARLVELVPAFEGEQLLDPTPGRLRVVFTRT